MAQVVQSFNEMRPQIVDGVHGIAPVWRCGASSELRHFVSHGNA
jgi:hypothetical protein